MQLSPPERLNCTSDRAVEMSHLRIASFILSFILIITSDLPLYLTVHCLRFYEQNKIAPSSIRQTVRECVHLVTLA